MPSLYEAEYLLLGSFAGSSYVLLQLYVTFLLIVFECCVASLSLAPSLLA